MPRHGLIALALIFAFAGAPALAQNTAAPPASVEAQTVAPAAPKTVEETFKGADEGGLTMVDMFVEAKPVPKGVMVGLLVAAMISWMMVILKLFEFANLNRTTTRFLAAFREAKTLKDMAATAQGDDFTGNPMADMTAAAIHEVELASKAGLDVHGEHRDMAIENAVSAVGAVQAQLSRRLSSTMQFQASLGASGPFIGLFGTVYGIMTSFISIVQSNSTSLVTVAPGIAEALLATGIGLLAAIPAVLFYNYFQSRITAYGSRTDSFVSELMTTLTRHLYGAA